MSEDKKCIWKIKIFSLIICWAQDTLLKLTETCLFKKWRHYYLSPGACIQLLYIIVHGKYHYVSYIVQCINTPILQLFKAVLLCNILHAVILIELMRKTQQRAKQLWTSYMSFLILIPSVSKNRHCLLVLCNYQRVTLPLWPHYRGDSWKVQSFLPASASPLVHETTRNNAL